VKYQTQTNAAYYHDAVCLVFCVELHVLISL
jgi:hypothetical protein